MAAHAFPQFYDGLETATYWWMGLTGAVGLFVCVLLHELGHAFIARKFGVEMKGITLFIFGGVAEMGGEPPNAKAEFFVAIAGPVVTAVLVGLLLLGNMAPLPTPIAGVISYLAVLNMVLLGFNAIPAFPLDGGRVLRAILWQIKGSLRWATNLSSQIGSGFGLALILIGVLLLLTGNIVGAIWWALIGMFLRGAAKMSYQQVLIRQVLEGEPVQRFMTGNPVTVPPSTTLDQFVEDYVYQHHFKLFPITEGEQLIGCITTRQVRQVPRDKWSDTTVKDAAESCDAQMTLKPNDDAMQALGMMNRNRVSRAMVVEDDRLVGVISLKDLMEYLSLKLELESDDGRGPAQVAGLPAGAE